MCSSVALPRGRIWCWTCEDRALPEHPVVQHQEREAEHPEGVLGPQLIAVDVDVQLLGEAVHGQRREFPGDGIDVGQVVAGVREIAAAGQHQAAACAGPRQQGGGETAVRHGETDADVAALGVPVGGVDADVDRFVGVGERTDPAADGDVVLVRAG